MYVSIIVLKSLSLLFVFVFIEQAIGRSFIATGLNLDTACYSEIPRGTALEFSNFDPSFAVLIIISRFSMYGRITKLSKN